MKRYVAFFLAMMLFAALNAGTAGALSACGHGNSEVCDRYVFRHLSTADANDVFHYVVTQEDYRCNDCGYEWREIVSEVTEAHSFEKVTRETENGVTTWDSCTACGHTCNRVVSAGCPHDWDGIQGRYWPEFSYTVESTWDEYVQYPSSYSHRLKEMIRVRCNNCGESITHVSADYYFNEDCSYENGVCTVCGSKKPGYTTSTPTPTPTPTTAPTAIPDADPPTPGPCGHDDHYSWVSESVYSYKKYSDSQHVRVKMIYWRCPCGEIMSEGGPWEQYESHRFDGGLCRDCGYQQQETVTTPPEAPSTTVPGVCTHETSAERLDESWSMLDEDRHIMSTVYRYSCACGQVSYTQTEEADFPHQVVDGKCRLCGYVQKSECDVDGHSWLYHIDEGYQECSRCGEREDLNALDMTWWEDYEEIIDTTAPSATVYSETAGLTYCENNVWGTIASQARDRLKKWGFVLSVNLVDNFANQSEAMAKTVIEEEDYSKKQETLWRNIILKMLERDHSAIAGASTEGEIDYAEQEKAINILNLSAGVINKGAALTGKISAEKIAKLQEGLKYLQTSANGDYTKELAADILKNKLGTAEKVNGGAGLVEDATGKVVPVSQCLLLLKSVVSAGSAAQEIAELESSYSTLASQYSTHMQTVDAIIAEAERVGNDELVSAANTVKEEVFAEWLERQAEYADVVVQAISDVSDSEKAKAAAAASGGTTLLTGVADMGLGKISPILDILGLAAGSYQCISNTDEIFVLAEDLMALKDMSNAMKITDLKGDAVADPSYFRLWCNLQAAGSEKAMEYVDAHVKNWSISDTVSTDLSELGLKEAERDSVLNLLSQDVMLYNSYSVRE